MRVVCISDTHGLHAALHEASPIPDGDVLVHAGDFTDTGDRDEVVAFNAFLATLPHKYKVVIAGNHESTFDRAFYPHNWYNYGHAQQYDPTEVRALLTNALYLEDQAVLIDGFLFYGSPWQPEFCNWAFNLPRGEKLINKWKHIPSDVDVLITHTPPMGRGDQVGHLRVGCSDLLHEVQTRVKPPYHVFGHVHEGYGRSSDGVTTFMNASSCTHEYEAVNPPMVINLRKPRATHDLQKNHSIRYDIMLHEQLRASSQKPVFVPLAPPAVHTNGNKDHPHGPCHSHQKRKGSLKEFSVDGTTSALLFESTLKLRPVKAKQTRALRYLFHHGFKTTVDKEDDLAQGMDDESVTEEGINAEPGSSDEHKSEQRVRERRRVSLSRRVTMAVLEELPESSRDAITPDSALFQTSINHVSAPAPSSAVTPQSGDISSAPANRRARRDKTLHRREAVAKLATMVEEPEKEAAATAAAIKEATELKSQAAVASIDAPVISIDPTPSAAQTTRLFGTEGSGTANPIDCEANAVSTSSTVSTSTQVIIPTTPAKECIMCKYNVPGHVHVSSDTNGAPPAAPATQAAEPPTKHQARIVTPPPPISTPQTSLSSSEISHSASSTSPAPPAPECILCKYKVAGHVHPGAETSSSDEVNEEENLNEEPTEEEPATETGRQRGVAPKRLSSWF